MVPTSRVWLLFSPQAVSVLLLRIGLSWPPHLHPGAPSLHHRSSAHLFLRVPLGFVATRDFAFAFLQGLHLTASDELHRAHLISV